MGLRKMPSHLKLRRMKTFVALSLFIMLQSPSRAAIVPSKSIYAFLDIFNSKNFLQEDGLVEVRATEFDKDGNLKKSKKKVSVPQADYVKFTTQASSVFQVIPTKPAKDDYLYQGTAFTIGHNLLLTNHHVLSRDFSNFNKCDTFQIKDNSNKFHRCHKVHFCSDKEDVCLIEISAQKSIGPPLKISNKWLPSSDTTPINAIGNSQGHGIHFSQARGLKRNQNHYTFYAAIRDGNSGGPILNQEGEVIGIVRTESKMKLEGSSENYLGILDVQKALVNEPASLAAFNLALKESGYNHLTTKDSHYFNLQVIEKMLASDAQSLASYQRAVIKAGGSVHNNAAASVVLIRLIREALVDDPETLENFNQSVLE